MGSKIALSIRIFFVVSSTSVLSPPITPAMHTGILPLVITISLEVRVRSLLSRVIISSPSLASRTRTVSPSLSLSKKCIGCPNSSIT